MKLAELKHKTIGVLMGGTSSEREVSLKTGRSIYKALREEGYKAVAIDVGKDIVTDLKKKKISLAFVALHGPLGEDGTIQGLLEVLGIPYTSSGVLASSLAMDKEKTKEVFLAYKIPTPAWQVVKKGQNTKVRNFPVVVKPVRQGSAVGVSIIDKPGQLSRALRQSFRYDDKAMIEQYIPGIELTVGVLNDKPLPVIRIIPQNKFYDFESKYAPGGSRHLIPPGIPAVAEKKAGILGLAAHQALGCRGATRVDMILDKQGRLFVLEVNTIPGMTETSLLPDAAKAAGYSFNALVLAIAQDADLNK
ncbi:MAG: D-alanine--D-alanine ligase [bacterium]|nr:D-alanine--D-alanine ligase [bacterium]MDD5354012.1 D-alanine--D-alanine ligase [bacterium]MDD5755919.1 D-alanine--D-alanine ligase [bacterium]